MVAEFFENYSRIPKSSRFNSNKNSWILCLIKFFLQSPELVTKCTIEGLQSCFFEIDRCEVKVFHTGMESDEYFEGKVSTYFTIHDNNNNVF